MTLWLGVLFYVLRLGTKMRKRRLAELPREVSLLRLHLRLAKPAVVFAMLGFVGGGASAVWLRGWGVLESFHGLLGGVAVVLFGLTALYGRTAARGGEGSDANLHGLLGVLAMLVAALSAIAGFVLLP
jgi:hypothetical protein